MACEQGSAEEAEDIDKGEKAGATDLVRIEEYGLDEGKDLLKEVGREAREERQSAERAREDILYNLRVQLWVEVG